VIYISGAITGTTDYMERFAAAEKRLSEAGFVVINPAKVNSQLPKETDYTGYMKMSLTMLSLCNGIYMIDGWEDSRGAKIEYDYAKATGLEFVGDNDVEIAEKWRKEVERWNAIMQRDENKGESE